jgi:hypothetical protein
MERSAPEQDQLAEQLGHLGQAEFAGFINDISADPSHAQISKSKKHREAEAVDYQWRRFQEDCEFEAAGGTLPAHERLWSERTEPGQGEPLEKVSGASLSKRAIDRGHRLLKILRRAGTAFSLDEAPSEDVLTDFRALLIEK